MRLRVRRPRQLSLIVSGGLVLLLGGLGLAAGNRATDTAIAVHRADRAELQDITGNLAGDYLGLLATEIDARGGRTVTAQSPWRTAPGDPSNAKRLQELVSEARSVDVGLVLVNAVGVPMSSATRDGQVVPASTDPGWEALRWSALAQTLPVSDLLDADTEPKFAVGVPTTLDNGTNGLLIGVYRARTNGLQTYVAGMTQNEYRHGWVLDGRGLVVAGATPDWIGRPIPQQELQDGVLASTGTIRSVEVDGTAYIVGSAMARATGWRAATTQVQADFQGSLVDTGHIVQGLLGAVLLMSGGGLLLLSRKREAALRRIAYYDDLTGVHNRRGWFELAEEELRRAERSNESRVLLFVDLDGLKQVNDVLGHREGDRAIVDAARVLQSASRPSDLVGRLGGDEFVLLLGDGTDATAARARLLDALSRHNACSRAGFELQLSLGAEVWFPEAAWSLDELVRRADAGMYEHKKSRPERSRDVVRTAAGDVPAPRWHDDRTPDHAAD